ncbi:MAG: DUF1854 domain-containing protein [Victivallales bacterium]|nr:DUF1854 domain-containing protein [Victivallales bacterium]
MRLLSDKEIEFAKDDSGVLCCKLADGSLHSDVHCISLFPLSMPGNYISVLAGGGADSEEIGIIQCLEDFADNQRFLISEAVGERYFRFLLALK